MNETLNVENNFYNLLDTKKSASNKQIIVAYKNKITKFNNLDTLDKNQIAEIKLLKIALYVLLDRKLKKKYNKIIDKKKNLLNEQVPTPVNNLSDDHESTLDLFFKTSNIINTNESHVCKKDKHQMSNTNILSDRIFSLTPMNNKNNILSDFESALRKPQQGRLDKSGDKINKPVLS